jgi:hypothetical protein
MKKKVYKVRDKIRMFNMEAAWYFIPIPLGKVPDVPKGGWSSVPVMATIGKTTWRTAMFPIKKEMYFIPLKKEVRKKEELLDGDTVTISYHVA